MSFIYDDEVISELLGDFFKAAQVAQNAKVNVEFQNYLNLADKLVNQLKEQYSPSAADPNASNVGAAQAANATINDVSTLGNFLDFLARHGVTVNGQRVAFFSNEEPPNKKAWLPVDAERSQLAVVQQDAQGNRTLLPGAYYVNKDLISKYMNDLLAQASHETAEAQRFLKVMLGGLVEKINKIFGTQLSTDYKPAPKTLQADEVLTTFPQVLDYAAYNQDGNIPLKWSDIQSGNAIRNWVNSNKVAIKDKQGAIDSSNLKFDFCVVVRTIYAKANWLLNNRAGNEKEAEKAKIFLDKITEVGPTMKGPNGQACSLGGAGASGNEGAAGAAPKVSGQALSQVVSAMPFALNDIDFNRIDNFFRVVEPLMNHVPQTQAYIDDVKAKMQDFSNRFAVHGDRIIPLGININQFANMLQQKGKGIYPAIDLLDQIIDGTRAVVDQFNGQYGPNPNFPEQQKAYIFGQIGKTPNDSSIYSRNARQLFKLRGTPTLGPAK